MRIHAPSDRSFLLQRVHPALSGLMDGSLSTLAPIFAVEDLARLRDVRHARELDPLDVADDGEPGQARTGARNTSLCSDCTQFPAASLAS
jgi:hypothetical protein